MILLAEKGVLKVSVKEVSSISSGVKKPLNLIHGNIQMFLSQMGQARTSTMHDIGEYG